MNAANFGTRIEVPFTDREIFLTVIIDPILIVYPSSNDTIIVSFTEESIVIRTHIPYVSPISNKYLKRDYEGEINDSFKPPRKFQPYCRCHAFHMAFRKAMDDLEELDRMNEGMHTDDTHTNQYDIHLECSLRLSTKSPIIDIHRECVTFQRHHPRDRT